MRKIDRIIVHCTATPEGRDVTVGEVRTWHLARNFSDVGYHYLITLNGTVEVGRPESKVGAHVRGHNKDSIGIAYAGGMDKSFKNPKDTRTPEQKEALIWLIDELKGRYPGSTVHGHNEYTTYKACPSFDVSKEGY
jgi:N-acetylmuramoyl-L-alanine amidase